MKTFIITIALLLFSTSLNAQVSVVVGKSSPHNKLSADEVKNIFTLSKTVWSSGSKIKLADQSKTSASKKFYGDFIGMKESKVKSTQLKAVLTGKAPKPIRCSDDAAVKKAVNSNVNAIGFIESSNVDDSVKVLFVID